MNKQEKIKLLQDKHLSEWLKTRKIIKDELSSKQPIFCICGKLATGLHEDSCRKFNKTIDKETVNRLKYLIL